MCDFASGFFVSKMRKALWLLVLASPLVKAQSIPDAPVPKITPQPENTFPAGTEPAPKNQHAAPDAQPDTPAGPPPNHPIETVKPGQPGSDDDNQEKLFTLSRVVSFVQVPVTVRDHSGHMVPGLTSRDFTVLEDGIPQTLSFFSPDPFAISAAIIVDTNLPADTMKKVNESLSALLGAFSPYDEVAIFRYGTTVQQVAAFTSASNVSAGAIAQLRRSTGKQGSNMPVSGPLAHQGPIVNGQPVETGQTPVYTPPQEAFVLNDAILYASKELSHRERVRRRIVFVISDGREFGSTAHYDDVRKVLLSNNITFYALGVDTAAIPIYDRLNRMRLPGFGYGNILPKYASETGGETFAEFDRKSIEQTYAHITEVARNQYTLGYNTRATASSTYREIVVNVHRPNLVVTSKAGYYPLPPQRH